MCLQAVVTLALVVGGGSHFVFDSLEDLPAEHPLTFASLFGLTCFPFSSSEDNCSNSYVFMYIIQSSS